MNVMNRRAFVFLTTMVLLFLVFACSAFAEDYSMEEPEYILYSSGETRRSNGTDVTDFLNKTFRVHDQVGGWYRFTAPAAGDYLFMVKAPSITHDFGIRIYFSDPGDEVARFTCHPSDSIQVFTLKDVPAGQTVYWWDSKENTGITNLEEFDLKICYVESDSESALSSSSTAELSSVPSTVLYLDPPGIAVRISEGWKYMKKGMTEEELARVTNAMTVAEVDEMYSGNVYCSVFMDENKQISIERDPSRDIFGPMTDEEKAQEFVQQLELKNAKEKLQKAEFYISPVTGMKYGKTIAPSTQYEPAATAFYNTLLGNKDVEIICRDFDGTIDVADEALFDALVDGISYGEPYGSLDPQGFAVAYTPALPEHSEEEEAPSAAPDASNPYTSVIEKYQKAKADDVSSAGEAFQRGISEWIFSYNHVGYGLVDLDGNGIEEMVIAGIDPKIDPKYADPVVFEIYTISSDAPVSLLCSEARSRYFLINDNKIINSGSGGANASSTAAYRVEGDHLKFVEGLSTVNRSDPSGQTVYHTTNWNTNENIKVPYGDYDRYDYTVPVDQYWPFLRELKDLYWLPDLTPIA